MKKERWD
jgi:hypothetical protein